MSRLPALILALAACTSHEPTPRTADAVVEGGRGSVETPSGARTTGELSCPSEGCPRVEFHQPTPRAEDLTQMSLLLGRQIAGSELEASEDDLALFAKAAKGPDSVVRGTVFDDTLSFTYYAHPPKLILHRVEPPSKPKQGTTEAPPSRERDAIGDAEAGMRARRVFGALAEADLVPRDFDAVRDRSSGPLWTRPYAFRIAASVDGIRVADTNARVALHRDGRIRGIEISLTQFKVDRQRRARPKSDAARAEQRARAWAKARYPETFSDHVQVTSHRVLYRAPHEGHSSDFPIAQVALLANLRQGQRPQPLFLELGITEGDQDITLVGPAPERASAP